MVAGSVRKIAARADLSRSGSRLASDKPWARAGGATLTRVRLPGALALTALSGALYGLAFPPVGWWPLAWVALVPFLVALRGSRPRRAIGLGVVLGITLSYGVGTWMPDAVINYYEQSFAVGVLIFLACALWQASWQYAAFALLYRRLAGRLTPPLAVGAAWTTAEVARTYVPFGNPWALLGYSQTAAPLVVQVADVTGVFGVSFLVMTVNAALAGWWCDRDRRARAGLGVAALTVAVALAYGAVRLREFDGGARDGAVPIATAQANLDLGTQWKSEFYGANLGAYADLTMQAVASHPARLVIWPESALTFFLESEPSYRVYLARLLGQARTTLLTGGPRVVAGVGGETFRNAAFVVTPDGDIRGVYEKRTLVPFAEYFPLAGVELLRRQFGKVREFTPGTRQEPLATPAGAAGMMICNEAMLGAEAVDRVRHGAEWLVTLTNDSWVGRRHYAEIAFAMVRLRAVEVRRWLVRSSTSGPSAIIDPAGRVVDRLPFNGAGYLRAAIEPRHGLTPYARVGDAFAMACCGATLLFALIRRR